MDLTEYDLVLFHNSIKELGLRLDDGQIAQFMEYYELLIEWNQFMNLTAITEFDEICTKHFIDSISLCKAVDCTRDYTVIDVGTGAGFPGIPLKIAFPNLKITLLDSLGKRVKFLNEVIKRLGLEDIEAIHGRAEDFAKPGQLREQFDLCVSRAVANLSTLSEYCLPYVKIGGFFISYKSEKISDEMQAARHAIELLGGNVYDQKEFILPNSDIYRNLFQIKKVIATPKKYPRKAGLPSKEPL
ncbi:MAG: 16S rRNA (guanine(527)-N(7))-methyltransferase RsmG [Lachnospiraceae bacterium]|nr:16S rRNA (guanine(527)-N(7))-methyltransferase RsmG [Lachnospiraceae bacterium]